MKRLLTAALAASILLPGISFALDFTGTHLPYSDIRKGSPEAAAVSLLTAEGVIQGYGDGTFRPNQTLNRAEFLKIVLLGHPDSTLSATDAADCFPDVKRQEWFAQYVCYAKEHAIVQGYPDGKFHPSNTVNYAEALKIMGELYAYPVVDQTGAWYMPYFKAAQEKGTVLPVALDFQSFLTRGQMARLAAGYRAEFEGELEEYRQAERGILGSSSSSSITSVSSVSSTSSVSSSSLSSSSVSSTVGFTLPAVSHFLVVGERSDAIASVSLPAQSEETNLRHARITLFSEVPAIDRLEIVTVTGAYVASLKQRTTATPANYKSMYEVDLETGSGYTFMANKPVDLIVRARLKPFENQGGSEQYLKMQAFTMRVYGEASGNTYDITFSPPFPAHQTAYGRITSVERNGPASALLTAGTGALIGSFAFSGTVIPNQNIAVTSLIFTPTVSSNVTVKNWFITTPSSSVEIFCARGIDGVTCPNIPSSIGAIGATVRILELRGDITIAEDSSPQTVQVTLGSRGSTSTLGAVEWTDGSGNFRWTDGPDPVAVGTAYQR